MYNKSENYGLHQQGKESDVTENDESICSTFHFTSFTCRANNMVGPLQEPLLGVKLCMIYKT